MKVQNIENKNETLTEQIQSESGYFFILSNNENQIWQSIVKKDIITNYTEIWEWKGEMKLKHTNYNVSMKKKHKIKYDRKKL